jgi:hypothetical protein
MYRKSHNIFYFACISSAKYITALVFYDYILIPQQSI